MTFIETSGITATGGEPLAQPMLYQRSDGRLIMTLVGVFILSWFFWSRQYNPDTPEKFERVLDNTDLAASIKHSDQGSHRDLCVRWLRKTACVGDDLTMRY